MKQDENLSRYAVMGLVLSGNRKATEALKSVQELLQPSDHRMASQMAAVRAPRSSFDAGEMVNEVLRANEEIADKGLAEYYGGK